MKNQNDQYDKLSESLNTSFEAHLPIKASSETPIISSGEDKVDKDYVTVRKNLYELIEKGKSAVDGILQVADAGDAPRAYEVVSQLLKTVSDMNKDVLHVHKEMKSIKEDNLNSNSIPAAFRLFARIATFIF